MSDIAYSWHIGSSLADTFMCGAPRSPHSFVCSVHKYIRTYPEPPWSTQDPGVKDVWCQDCVNHPSLPLLILAETEL